uniref:Uncharacterized protein n=1 Tax=Arundo donax TaxID=35708 RepID=A0A0A9A308_ARUDO
MHDSLLNTRANVTCHSHSIITIWVLLANSINYLYVSCYSTHRAGES